jgi:hypothetical protein
MLKLCERVNVRCEIDKNSKAGVQNQIRISQNGQKSRHIEFRSRDMLKLSERVYVSYETDKNTNTVKKGPL